MDVAAENEAIVMSNIARGWTVQKRIPRSTKVDQSSLKDSLKCQGEQAALVYGGGSQSCSTFYGKGKLYSSHFLFS